MHSLYFVYIYVTHNAAFEMKCFRNLTRSYKGAINPLHYALKDTSLGFGTEQRCAITALGSCRPFQSKKKRKGQCFTLTKHSHPFSHICTDPRSFNGAVG